MDLPSLEARVVHEVDINRFRRITESALEGLAKRELNLSNIVAKSIEAKERRLVPEVIEHFFVEAAPTVGVTPKPVAKVKLIPSEKPAAPAQKKRTVAKGSTSKKPTKAGSPGEQGDLF